MTHVPGLLLTPAAAAALGSLPVERLKLVGCWVEAEAGGALVAALGANTALSELKLGLVNFDEAGLSAPAPLAAAAPPFLAREARMAPRDGSFAVIVQPHVEAAVSGAA